MGKDMGEFEQRPRVQEATSVPLRRRKPTGWIMATIFFAVVAVGAVVFAMYSQFMNDDSGVATKCDVKEPSEKSEKKVTASKGFAIKDNFGVLYVTKDGDVYLAPTTQTEKDNGWPYLMRASDYDTNKLPGERGKYTITEEDIVGFGDGPSDMKENDYKVTFDGFKIDIDSVVSVSGPLMYGHAFNGFSFALIRSNGSMSWLVLAPGNSDMKAFAKLTDNVGNYNNVASVISASPAGGTNGILVIMKDGGHEWIDYKVMSQLEGYENTDE